MLVAPVAKLGPDDLVDFVLSAAKAADHLAQHSLNGALWVDSLYRPVPNIIEAAEAIFRGHQVREIAHAQSENLSTTTDSVLAAVVKAQAERHRVLCFITGVPGAGKTLAGLALAHRLVR